MCSEHHGHHRGRGLRGRRGFPNREQWLERLQGYQQHLEDELKNVQDLIERLGPDPEQTASV